MWIVLTVLIIALGLAPPARAAFFTCASGDVACLITAINTSNANGEVNLIRLDAGTYTLTAVDNSTDGSNGLPSITSPLTIGGNGSANTIIERGASAPEFRVFHVGQSGSLNLEDVTVRGGRWGFNQTSPPPDAQHGGAGIFNRGTTIITHCAVTNNLESFGGGGIASLGRLFIAGSTVVDNQSRGPGGGILGTAAVTVINSTIRHNIAEGVGGGIAIRNAAGNVTIVGSTLVANASGGSSGGGLYSDSTAVAIVNSTVANNKADTAFGGGLSVAGGVVVNSTIAGNHTSFGGRALSATGALALHNTIISGPSEPTSEACRGQVTSLDNNIFFDPNCAVALLPHDRIGDPGLGDFIDFGVPGRGFFLLADNSQALDAGDNAACLPTDQRGRLRNGGCDVGAIEGTTP